MNDYQKRLGLKSDKPTHFELLNITPEIVDVQLISQAAERQTQLVLELQGEHVDEDADRLICQIEYAELVLCSPILRLDYDRRLKEKRKSRNLNSFLIISFTFAFVVPSTLWALKLVDSNPTVTEKSETAPVSDEADVMPDIARAKKESKTKGGLGRMDAEMQNKLAEGNSTPKEDVESGGGN